MSLERVVPYDELTGHPLPIVPVEANLRGTWHHAAFNKDTKKRAPERKNPANIAIRSAILQRLEGPGGLPSGVPLEKLGQHSRVHHFYDRSFWPKGEDGVLKYTIAALAENIPSRGIDVSDNEPEEREFREGEIVRLRAGDIKIAQFDPLLAVLETRVANQDFSGSENMVDDFVNSGRKTSKRRILGSELLNIAIEQTAEPVSEMYQKARELGRFTASAEQEATGFISRWLEVRGRDHIIGRLYLRLNQESSPLEIKEPVQTEVVLAA